RNYDGAGRFAADAPLNVVPNPSVIPVIAQGAVTASNAARLEITYYHPATHAFTGTDARLEWTATSTDGASVRFYDGGANKAKGFGTKVMAYGVTEGEVTFEIRYVHGGLSMLVAKYRALVRRVGKVKYRATICHADGDFCGDGSV